MTSEAKTVTNRQNAMKSTGPRTLEGKSRSSRNALTHGITAKHFVADGESVEEFEELAQNVLDQFPPKTELEKHQVHRLIELLWRLKRARLFETAALSVTSPFNFLDPVVPETYQGMLPNYEKMFELADKIDARTERTWREISKIVDNLASNRLIPPEPVTIDGQSEEIPAPDQKTSARNRRSLRS